ncbi:MAG TPA: hypothetical protein VM051_04850 [Usitatibacter sp.]|nr:hypothetical protein [Usitatibacter sp.]
MIDVLRRYPLIVALAVLTAVLVAVVALEFAAGSALRERAAAGTGQGAAPVQTKLLPQIAAVNPDAEYAETGSRPLFTPTRRPAPAQAVVASGGGMVKGQFVLTGVTIVGENRIALLREKSSGRVVRVEQGKEVNGIKVAQIEPEKVTLAQGGEQEVVGMLVSKAGVAPGMVPTAAAGPFAAPAPTPGQPNPAARISQPAPQPQPGFVQPPAPGQPPPPPVNPNTLFGPRPGGLTPVPDPTTGQTPVAPLSPEELLARRRARRNQQTQ